ncbi:helix-turn-helix protein [Microbacterium sp. AG790]|uniref:helix-turn-helix domain-containing protein n=1 Tax=Microbacterium sp. AG790 TaxID=2183995 RepID=UPI000EAF5009|nr:helix-turn-helix transcriptional regulator [Microbacterium sp. AG790]RKS84819.1 helix-turn-helix protein [Microbacterium sp. AG790]
MGVVQYGQLDEAEPAFGKWVRERRQSLALSQSDLVQRLASRGLLVDASAISRIESGARSVRLGEAIGIADALDSPLGAEFFTYKSPDSSALVEALSSIERALFRREEAIAADHDALRAIFKRQETAHQHLLAVTHAEEVITAALPSLSPTELELLNERLRSLRDIEEWQHIIELAVLPRDVG